MSTKVNFQRIKVAGAAIALLASFGIAHAYDSQGGQVGATSAVGLNVGGSTFSDTDFHGPNGAPGLGFENYVISLQSITFDTFKVGEDNGFKRYFLDGYTHKDPNQTEGNISTQLLWTKVPTTGSAAKQVYFGLATNKDTSQTVAYYVGDRDGFVVPNATTNYTTVANVAKAGVNNAAGSPIVLTGTLQLNAAANTLNTTGNGLVGTTTSDKLTIAATVNKTAGTFSGNSNFNNVANSNSVKGQFFGGGTNSTSALAGTVNGTGYIASFGGVKN